MNKTHNVSKPFFFRWFKLCWLCCVSLPGGHIHLLHGALQSVVSDPETEVQSRVLHPLPLPWWSRRNTFLSVVDGTSRGIKWSNWRKPIYNLTNNIYSGSYSCTYLCCHLQVWGPSNKLHRTVWPLVCYHSIWWRPLSGGWWLPLCSASVWVSTLCSVEWDSAWQHHCCWLNPFTRLSEFDRNSNWTKWRN